MLATVMGTHILFKTQSPCCVQSSATYGPKLNVCYITLLVMIMWIFISTGGHLYKVLRLHAGPLMIV